MTVVQASLVDISTKEWKGRNFAYFNMALGMGFTLGPFFGGVLCDGTVVSWFNYSTPFLFGAIATVVNLILLKFVFEETRAVKEPRPIELLRGFVQAKKAFSLPSLRLTFLAFFFFVFGWDYFFEFISVTLMKLHAFSTSKVGFFNAYTGLWYALSNLLIVGRLIKRFAPVKLLLFSLVSGGAYLIGFSWIQNSNLFWVFAPGLVFIMSLFFPVASTYISDMVSDDEQGEILGIWTSIQALSLIVSPLFSGSLVGDYPLMPITLGAGLMGCGGLIFTLISLRQRKQAQGFDKGL